MLLVIEPRRQEHFATEETFPAPYLRHRLLFPTSDRRWKTGVSDADEMPPCEPVSNGYRSLASCGRLRSQGRFQLAYPITQDLSEVILLLSLQSSAVCHFNTDIDSELIANRYRTSLIYFPSALDRRRGVIVTKSYYKKL